MSRPAGHPARGAATGPDAVGSAPAVPLARGAATGPDAVGSAPAVPLTLGTAGHVDHGKTALVGALTGVDTDRLPEERERGLSIVLGYAPLRLPSGRALSVVDVPGHERFVRTMVAGASGIDAFLMVVAADDGVMPQTAEHAAVLRALGIERGVVAVSRADLADPSRALAESAELLPGLSALACSARTGAGLDELRAELDRLAASLPGRRGDPDAPVRLHADRAFTVAGRGTVITGTLWSGRIVEGHTLELIGATQPSRRPVRVRSVQVHDAPVPAAPAGQRVAVNLVGLKAGQAGRGDVLATPGTAAETSIVDCALELRAARHGERVQVHHGTRDTAARLCDLGDGMWQLRLQRPLAAVDGDRVVVRRLAPADTLGGGVVLDAAARRHGRRPEILSRLELIRAGAGPAAVAGEGAADLAPPTGPGPVAPVRPGSAPRAGSRPDPAVVVGAGAPAAVDPASLQELERRLRESGPALLSEAQMEGRLDALRALRAGGSAVRVSGRLYGHAETVERIRSQIIALLMRDGSATLAGVRDALGLSRKSAQAFLEHLDAARLTRRLPDDSRVLTPRAVPQRDGEARHGEARHGQARDGEA